MHEVRLPKLGDTVDDAEIISWEAAEGAAINQRQVIAVLETEKSSIDLESEYKGILHIVRPASDEKVKVGEVIAVIADSPEEYEQLV